MTPSASIRNLSGPLVRGRKFQKINKRKASNKKTFSLFLFAPKNCLHYPNRKKKVHLLMKKRSKV